MAARAHKQTSTQQAKSTDATSHKTSFAGNHSAFALPAGSRSPRVAAEESEANLDTTASTRLLHNFSQIAVYPKTHATIQTKLLIGQPNDFLEQEANQVSDRVMAHEPGRIYSAHVNAAGDARVAWARPGRADAIAEQMPTLAVALPVDGRGEQHAMAETLHRIK